MKKILYTGAFVLATAGMMACERTTDSSNTTEGEGTVVERDSVATEYEVTETVVEYDTTTRTKTVDVDKDKDKDDNR
ncbi:hypothetical protein [Pontibacter roseus]|uniref:hypothetical protein n=1 Tax=Pontibacter roseus TaxID=336989 RepID=UPI001FDFFB51|nr:hypothetical protein [Pontibacter roseus]